MSGVNIYPACLLSLLLPLLLPLSASPTDDYIALTMRNLTSLLPRAQRSPASVLRLCRDYQQRLQRIPCAWMRQDPVTELVLFAACFDETRTPCNRATGKSSQDITEQLSVRFHRVYCNGCRACSHSLTGCETGNIKLDKRPVDSDVIEACPPLRCYCSCAGGSHGNEADLHFVYPCDGVCDGDRQCPNGQDEDADVCARLYRQDPDVDEDVSLVLLLPLIVGASVPVATIGLGVLTVWLVNRRLGCLPWLHYG